MKRNIRLKNILVLCLLSGFVSTYKIVVAEEKAAGNTSEEVRKAKELFEQKEKEAAEALAKAKADFELVQARAAGGVTKTESPADKKADWIPAAPQDEKFGSWTLVEPGNEHKDLKIRQISVGNTNQVWAVGEDNKVYQATLKGWKHCGDDRKMVACGCDETVMTINDKGEVFKYKEEKEWEQIPGLKLDQIAVASRDIMWGISQGELLRHVDYGKWEPVKNVMNQQVKNIVFVGVNDEDIVFAINDKGEVLLSTTNQREKVEQTSEARKKLEEEDKKDKKSDKKDKKSDKKDKKSDKKEDKKNDKKEDKKDKKNDKKDKKNDKEDKKKDKKDKKKDKKDDEKVEEKHKDKKKKK